MMSLRGRGGDRQTASQPARQTATTAEQTGLLVFFYLYVATVKEKTKFYCVGFDWCQMDCGCYFFFFSFVFFCFVFLFFFGFCFLGFLDFFPKL
jgi:hypothetical protein